MNEAKQAYGCEYAERKERKIKMTFDVIVREKNAVRNNQIKENAQGGSLSQVIDHSLVDSMPLEGHPLLP